MGDTTVYNIGDDEWYSSENDQHCPMPYSVQGAGWALFDYKILCFRWNETNWIEIKTAPVRKMYFGTIYSTFRPK